MNAVSSKRRDNRCESEYSDDSADRPRHSQRGSGYRNRGRFKWRRKRPRRENPDEEQES